MKKTFLVLTLVLALLVSAFALAETAAQTDPVLASACDGEMTVTLSEVKTEYDEMLAYYAYMYSMYGMQVDEYDTEFQSEIAQGEAVGWKHHAVQLSLFSLMHARIFGAHSYGSFA